MAETSSGLSLVPKLKKEHLELTSFSRMRVDLAAQVDCCSFEFKGLKCLSFKVLSNKL